MSSLSILACMYLLYYYNNTIMSYKMNDILLKVLSEPVCIKKLYSLKHVACCNAKGNQTIA